MSLSTEPRTPARRQAARLPAAESRPAARLDRVVWRWHFYAGWAFRAGRASTFRGRWSAESFCWLYDCRY